MQRQGGHSTTKGGGAGRRGLVLRFLGGCEGNELTEFIQLLTLPFRDILKGEFVCEFFVHVHTCILHMFMLPQMLMVRRG